MPSHRLCFAALTAFLLTLFMGPKFIKKLYELKMGQSIRKEECEPLYELHKKKKETPTMGGILILFSLLMASLVWMDLKSPFIWILLGTTFILGAVGGYDDYLKIKYKNARGLSGKKKLLVQLLLAASVALYMIWPSSPMHHVAGSYFLPFVAHPLLILSGGALAVAFLFTLFVIVGSSNAVNLTDGLDGLAAGCMILASLVFALVAFLSGSRELASNFHLLYIEGASEMAVFLAALVGASLGFVWFNGYPAQLFMGDIGSLTMGGILGVSAVLLRKEGLLALVGAIFVAEALSVILQVGSYKLCNKKRIFLCAPLHHHFEYKGIPETKVVIRFWIVAFLLAALGTASVVFV